MIGLPVETDEDVAAIADSLPGGARSGAAHAGDQRASRLQLNVSVNNFIPKPFTPFQWAGMADRATLGAPAGPAALPSARRGMKLSSHGVDKSYLEAALARGGEEMGAVILEAWSKRGSFRLVDRGVPGRRLGGGIYVGRSVRR